MSDDPMLDGLVFSELDTNGLQRERQALIDLTRAAATAGLAPGFPRDGPQGGPDTWLGWYWDEVIQREQRREVRVFVAHLDQLLVATVQSVPIRSPGWGGWEPWKRLELRDPIVLPDAPPGIEEAIMGHALSRALFDLAVVEATPGGRIHEAAERLGFRPSSVIPDLVIGPDGSPHDAILLTRSHDVPAVISPALLAQVEAVTPSTDGRLLYRPCQVVLDDGRTVDRVYVQEAWTWKAVWGAWPNEDRDESIPIDSIASVSESRSRIAPRLADRLLEAGETGMGYTKFTLILRDGRKINTMTGGAVDFPGLPAGVVASDVEDVIIHEHVGDPTTAVTLPQTRWCLYTLPKDRSH
jgi:hypothetical protein